MGVENFAKVTQEGKRSVKRARVLLAVRLQTSFGEIEGRLRDLSQRGALVECSEPLDVGMEVVFSRGDTVVPARVAWVSANRIGLEFLRMIDESEVLVQLSRTSSNASQPRFRRPRLNGEGLSEHERKLAKAWGVAVGLAVPD
jgi:hypothetical protein